MGERDSRRHRYDALFHGRCDRTALVPAPVAGALAQRKASCAAPRAEHDTKQGHQVGSNGQRGAPAAGPLPALG